MPRITLNGILWAGIFLAFLLPIIGYVAGTLPPATGISAATQANLTSTSNYIQTHLFKTYNSLNSSLLGSGSGFAASTSGIIGLGIFIINGFSGLMLVITQVPQLDVQAMHLMITGMAGVVGPTVTSMLNVGAYLLYIYLAISLLLLGVSMIMKYSALD